MKQFRHLVESLPAKTAVFAFGRFNPPTTGHQLLVKFVKKLAKTNGADCVVYTSTSQDKKNPLTVEKKVHYLNLMFPGTVFGSADSVVAAAKKLNEKYRHIVMVAGSDCVQDYERILTKHNGVDFHFDSIKVMSAGERDGDYDDTKLKAAAKGDFPSFKKGLPSTLRDIDGKRLMNDVRAGLGLEHIKEHIVSAPNALRESYLAGDIFKLGELVESSGQRFEIIDRGSNYLTVVNGEGTTFRKWLHECKVVGVAEDVQPGYAPAEISFKGYTTKNLHHSGDAAKAFQQTIERYGKNQPATVLAALKATDAYMKLNDMHLEQGKAPDAKELAAWRDAHQKARDSLNRIGEFMHHEDYWHMHEHELQDMETKYNPETAGAEMADSYQPQAELVEANFADTMKKAITAHERGDHARAKYHLDNAKTARYAMKSTDVAKHKDLLDKYTELRKLHEDIVNKGSSYNVAKDILRYKDFAKLKKLNNEEKPAIVIDPNDEDDGGVAPSATQIAASKLEKQGEPHTATGSMLDGGDEQLRRRKVAYKLGEDVQSADFKVSPTTGRKYRARHINFQASGQNSNPVEGDDEHSEKSTAAKIKHNKPLLKKISEEVDEEQMSDKELESIADGIDRVEDVLDAYEDSELCVIDADTGEEVASMKEEFEQLNEVLSRIERMKAKIRFARTESKRERKIQVALRTRSSSTKINQRARTLAVSLMKQRLMKKPVAQMTVQEKERAEAMIAKRKAAIGRLAMKLAPRIRKIENERLSHSKVTK